MVRLSPDELSPFSRERSAAPRGAGGDLFGARHLGHGTPEPRDQTPSLRQLWRGEAQDHGSSAEDGDVRTVVLRDKRLWWVSHPGPTPWLA